MLFEKDTNLSDSLFKKYSDFFYDKSGIRLKDYKKYLLVNRLSKFINENSNCRNFNNLFEILKNGQNPELVIQVTNSLTTNFSFFFREQVHFDFLKFYLEKNYRNMDYIRIWSAAGSTGEEAYSIGITASDCIPDIHTRDFKILASDISTKVVNKAIEGRYNIDKVESYISENKIRQYFNKQNNEIYVKDSLKKLISFRYLNLLDNYPFKKEFDIVFLRNVLIYFDNNEKEIIINKMYDHIKKDGFLILGMSESTVGIKHPFKHLKYSIMKKT